MFPKGVSGNPGGRPPGSKNGFTIELLEKALNIVSEEKKVDLFKHFIERALISDTVLIALMKKVLPDKAMPLIENNQTVNVQQASRSALINFDPAEINRIRKDIVDLRARTFKALSESEIEKNISPEMQAHEDKVMEQIKEALNNEKQFMISLIKPEMSKDAIFESVGYPDLLSEENGLDIWFYKRIEKSEQKCENVWVTFENGKCIKANIYGIV